MAKMTKEEKEIRKLVREQIADMVDCLFELGLGEELGELDYYPEDEHEQAQRAYEFQMADPLGYNSDN